MGHAKFEAPFFLTADEVERNEDKVVRIDLETQGRMHFEIKAKYIVHSERLNKARYVRLK